MKRHLVAQPAAPVTLSVEEEAILIDEHNTSNNDLVAMEVEIDRMDDTQDIVTDVQSVIAQTETVGEVEQSLIGAVGDMAAAGTDACADDIIPQVALDGVSTEGFIENVKERVAKIWEAIKDFIRKTWNHIKAFFRTIVNFMSPLKKKEAAVEKILDDHKANANASVSGGEAKGRTHVGRISLDFAGDASRLCMTGETTIVPPERMVSEVKHLVAMAGDTINGFLDLQEAFTLPTLEVIRKSMADVNAVSEAMSDIKDRIEGPQTKFFQKMHFHPGYEKTPGDIATRRDSGYPKLLGGIYVGYRRRMGDGMGMGDPFDYFTYHTGKNKPGSAKSQAKSLNDDELADILEESKRFTKSVTHPKFLSDIEAMEKMSEEMIKMVDALKAQRPKLSRDMGTFMEKYTEGALVASYGRMLLMTQAATTIGIHKASMVIIDTGDVLKSVFDLACQAEKTAAV
jgi:hypothetical protein